ncbi:MAG: hypothetical protein PWQ57_1666 [Desulfovibrionales bacterium]|jgi:Tfp pilus assembly protein PilN|nr:hypothetical protein [Desulfovibrionales bacterium]
MATSQEKVHHLEDYKAKTYTEESIQDVGKASPRDMGKAAIIIAILSVVLLVIFFFGLNQNLAGLTKQVAKLSSLEGEVARIDETVTAVDARMTELEKLPQKTRNMMIDQSLDELSNRLNYMSGYLGDEESSDKLYQAMQLLKQVQAGLDQ